MTSCVLVVFELARPAKRCATPALELANGVGTLAGCEVVLEVGQDGVGEAVVATSRASRATMIRPRTVTRPFREPARRLRRLRFPSGPFFVAVVTALAI